MASVPYAAAAVVVLLAAGTLAALAPGPVPMEAGPHGVEGALAAAHEALAHALDDSTAVAVGAAARASPCDVGQCLDAALRARVVPRFPLSACGWTVSLLDVEGGLLAVQGPPAEEGGASPRATACARLDVLLARARGGDHLRAEVLALGGDAGVPLATALASRSLAAMGGDGGPLVYALQSQLWQLAQGRALAGGRSCAHLLGPEDVTTAVGKALAYLEGGVSPPPPAPPPLDLAALVSDSIAGMLGSTMGSWDEYLGLDGALSTALEAAGIPVPEGALATVWPWDRVERAAACAVQGLVVGALEGAVGRLPAIAGGDLTSTVASSCDALDGLAVALEECICEGDTRAAASDVVRAALEGLLDRVRAGETARGLCQDLLDALERAASEGGWPFGPMLARAVEGLAACALAAARLGVQCAREALLAVLANGVDVATVGPHAPRPVPSRLRIELEGFEVEQSWEGTSACEPGRLAGALVATLLDGDEGARAPFGALPYVSFCTLRLSGMARVTTHLEGAAGTVPVEWREGLDLGLEVAVASSRALEGVAYAPSRTVETDIEGAARAVWDAALEGLGHLACRVRDAGEWVASQLDAFGRDVLDSVLGQSAYTLSRSLFAIAESLARGSVDKALNATWDLLARVAGDALRERLTWRFGAFGLEVEAFLDPFAQRAGVTVERDRVTASVEVKRLAEGRPPFRPKPVGGFHWGVFGRAEIDMGREGVVVDLDPLTLERSCALTATARWGDDGRGGPSQELVVEAVGASKSPVETGVRLSSLLGGGAAMALAGGVGVVDAGVVLRSERDARGDLGELGLRALKRAWLGSVRGLTVGGLAEGLAEPPDLGSFAEGLLRELYFALVEEASGLARELEAFVEVDPPGPGWPSVRVGLVMREPLGLLLPLAAWARHTIPRMAGAGASASVGGAGRGLASSVAEHVLLRLELGWTVRLPPPLGGGRAPPEAGLVVRTEANLAALQAVAGGGEGGWEASATVMLRGVPAAALSVVPGLCPVSWGRVDVVLLRAVLRDARAALLLISQVHYDARGRDSELEYVMLLNAGGRVVDAGGLTLEDDAGAFAIPGHTLVWPGGTLLVVRDRASVRAEWGVEADVSGMGLRLANDGDVVRLSGPHGVVLDEVAWEGFAPGWERLGAREGEALVRVGGDLRWCAPGAWSAGAPCPSRGGGPW